MKKFLLPTMIAAGVMAIGSIMPVYASESEDDLTLASGALLPDESIQELSSSLIKLPVDSQAAVLVKQDILSKEEAAKKAAAEKAKKAAAEKAAKEKAAREKAQQEAKRLAAEKAKREEEARQAEAAKQKAAEKAAATEATEAAASEAGGQVLYMESTAYSSDPADALGGGSVTATGQNLLENPMAVAVDPSVIPLGTRLYVEGYGEAYAVDTGSAIQGNIIDVHFSTAEQCYAWGRRQVKVTILG